MQRARALLLPGYFRVFFGLLSGFWGFGVCFLLLGFR